jgi:hypothetical protein
VEEGETLGELEVEIDDVHLVRDEPVLDERPISTGGADAAEFVR